MTYRVRAEVPHFDALMRFNCPRQVARFLTPILESEAVEVFGVLCLTSKHCPIAWHALSRGTLDSTLVHPRELFKVAFLANAAALVVFHYVARHIMRLMCRRSLCGVPLGRPSFVSIPS